MGHNLSWLIGDRIAGLFVASFLLNWETFKLEKFTYEQ